MQIIKGGFSFVEFDSTVSFSNPRRIDRLLKSGTTFTPKTYTEELADNKAAAAGKGLDMSIRTADVNNAAGSPYAALKAYEEAHTPIFFRFVKILGNDLLVEDCEDAFNENVHASVTSATDAVNYKAGTKSTLLTLANTTIAAGTMLASEVISKDLTGYKAVSFWIKHELGCAAGDFALLLDNTANCASPLEVLPLPVLPADTWVEVTLPMLTPSGLGSLISVGLRAVVELAYGATCKINLDDIRAVTGHVTVLNNVIPKVHFEMNEAGKHNALKILGEGFSDTEANLLTLNI